MAEPVFPCYPPIRSRIPLKNGRFWQFFIFVYFIVPSEFWMMVDFVGRSSKKYNLIFVKILFCEEDVVDFSSLL